MNCTEAEGNASHAWHHTRRGSGTRLYPLTQIVARCHPLDAKLRYCRFRLRQPITEPLPRALPTQCFFLAERTLVQVAGGKTLIIGGTAHLLVPGVLAGAKGTLIVMVGNRVFSLAVEKCAAEAPALALETIASVEPVHAEAIKRFLLSRCTELYRSSRAVHCSISETCFGQ